MAQAVAAQALARAGLVPEARLAFAAIPKRLVNERETGTWIRLYGFSDIAVLNAQLQAALSLADYARLAARRAGGAARDPAAARGAPRASGLRHRPLVALRPRRQRGAARLSPVRDVAALEARADDGQRALGHARRAELPRRLAAAARDPRPRRPSTGAAAAARRLPRRRGDPVLALEAGVGRAHDRGRAGHPTARPGPSDGPLGSRGAPLRPLRRRARPPSTESETGLEARLEPVVVARDTTAPALRATAGRTSVSSGAPSDRETPWLTLEIELSAAAPPAMLRLPTPPAFRLAPARASAAPGTPRFAAATPPVTRARSS